MVIDQVRGRRAGIGLRGHDPEKAFQGYTLYAANNSDGEVWLIDMSGEIVHTWTLPHPPGLYGRLTPAGTLLYNGKVVDAPGSPEAERFISSQPWKGGVVLEATWSGRVLWEVRHPSHHHDGTLLRNGNVVLLGMGEVPNEIAARVRGGRPGSEHHGRVHADTVVEMSTAGEIVWEWRAWEHLDPEVDVMPAVQDERAEWTHANSVSECRDGSLLVSFRNLSTVVRIDRVSGAMTWKLTHPTISHQHAPHELENGNILIFDNGTHRLDHTTPYSRVIEVDPASGEIVWSYQEKQVSDFFSPFISNAQRLPNGNTLICEGSFGRLFEVTAEGEVVWEFVNPHFLVPAYKPDAPPSNRVFRAHRYGSEQIEQARSTR